MKGVPFDSEEFDAALALATQGVRPPVPNALPRDHLLQCRVYLPAWHPLAISPTDQDRAQSAKRKPDPAKDRGHARGVVKVDVIADMMEGLACKGGPMAWLSGIVKRGEPVRVATRHRRGGQRGVSTGKIVAFDKHMNVVMQDVMETYTVRKMVYKERIDAMRPVLETRTRSIANCVLTGRSIVSIQSGEGLPA